MGFHKVHTAANGKTERRGKDTLSDPGSVNGGGAGFSLGG